MGRYNKGGFVIKGVKGFQKAKPANGRRLKLTTAVDLTTADLVTTAADLVTTLSPGCRSCDKCRRTMVEEQVKSRKVVRCQSCVSFTRMNKQVLLSRNRAASILKKTCPQLILLKEGTYNGAGCGDQK